MYGLDFVMIYFMNVSFLLDTPCSFQDECMNCTFTSAQYVDSGSHLGLHRNSVFSGETSFIYMWSLCYTPAIRITNLWWPTAYLCPLIQYYTTLPLYCVLVHWLPEENPCFRDLIHDCMLNATRIFHRTMH